MKLNGLIACLSLVFLAQDGVADVVFSTVATSTTRISGYSGAKVLLGREKSEYKAINDIRSRERQDKPCYVSAKGTNMNERGATTYEKDLCGARGPTSNTLSVFTNAQTDDIYISGIRICMNNNNTRMKGLEIRTRKLNESGTLVDYDTSRYDSQHRLTTNKTKDERTNCKNWKKWADCEAGYLPSALELHYSAGNEPRSLTGVALVCRRVNKK